MIEFNYGSYPTKLNSVKNNIAHINSAVSPFFVAGIENNVQAKFDIESTITSIENGDKTAIANLEKLGYPYTLEERKDGYKLRFETDGVKYTISYVDGSLEEDALEPTNNSINLQNTSREELDQIIDQLFQQSQDMFQNFQEIPVPVAPMVSDYATEKDYAKAYEKYQDDMDMYDKHLLEYNKKIAGLQLASDAYETQAEMLDHIEKVQDVVIPNPPIKTDSMTEEEYNKLMSVYEKEVAEYRTQSYLYDLRSKMLNARMNSTMAILNWLTSKMKI